MNPSVLSPQPSVLSSQPSVLIFGATGYTGQLTAQVLAERGINLILAGRDKTRLEKLRLELKINNPTIVADPLEPASLPFLFERQPKLIINCVGPFTKYGEAVVLAAISAGAHYLDITGEQAYIGRVLDLYNQSAEDRGVAVVAGCGFEYAVGNWAATAAAEGLEPLDTITVSNAVAAGAGGVSQGTALSVFEALKNPGRGWKDGKRQVQMVASEGKTVEFPAPIGKRRVILAPFGEPLTLPRHIQVKNVKGYITMGGLGYWFSRATFPLLPVFAEVGSVALKPFIRRGGPGSDKRTTTDWAIVAEAHGPQGSRKVTLQGKDVYYLTAQILAYCAKRILDPTFNKKGSLGPAQAFEAAPALEYLKSLGTKVTSNESKVE